MSYFKNSNASLVLLIAILLATNIATVVTIFYNQSEEVEVKVEQNKSQHSNKLERRHRKFGNYMSNRLSLNDKQQLEFASLREVFHTKAEVVSLKINEKRKLLYVELAKDDADIQELNKISDEIGLLHAELKKLSVKHYINMKEICTPEQQEKLYQMFKAMFKKESRDVEMIHKRKHRKRKKY